MDEKFSSFQMLQLSVKDVREWFEDDEDESWLWQGVNSLVIPFLKRAISEEFKSLKELYRVRHENNKAPTVVHYTSVDTVIKMFRDYSDKKASYLRLYDTFHFNDPDEGKYLKLEKSDPRKTTSPCAYATSFVVPRDTEKIEDVRDNLVFWRTYGREGTGCSLAIKIPPHRLYQVKYGPAETSAAVEAVASIKRKVMDALSPMMDLGKNGPKEQGIPALLKEETAVALREEAETEAVLYLHKSKAYEYENEARVIKTVRSIKKDKKEKKRDIVFEYESSKGRDECEFQE